MVKREDITPSVTLSIDQGQLCFIIAKAKEFDAQVPPDDPDSGSNPTDDNAIDVLNDSADDPTALELRGAVAGLNMDQRAELLALCWLGRGDYSAADWDEALREAQSTQDRNLANYLLGTPLLGDYLEEGYNQLGYSCEDFDLDRR